MHSYYPKESAMHYSAWLGTDIPNADNMGTDNAASTDSIPYKKIQAGKTNSLFFFLSFSSDCFRKSMSTQRPQKEHREAAKTKDRWNVAASYLNRNSMICKSCTYTPSFLVTQVSLLCLKAEGKKITYAGSCKYKRTTAACCMSNYPTYQHHQRNTVQ